MPSPFPHRPSMRRTATPRCSRSRRATRVFAHPVPGPGEDEDEDETPIGDPDEDDWDGEDWDEDDDEPIQVAAGRRQIVPAKRRVERRLRGGSDSPSASNAARQVRLGERCATR